MPRPRGSRHYNWKGGRGKSGGYIMVKCPGHPRSHGRYERVLEHILIAEEAVGKPLPESAQVHHVNGNGLDNRPGNLVVCEDQHYHRLLHRRQEAYEACGNPRWRKCLYCGEYSPLEKMTGPSTRKRARYHRDCRNEYRRNLRKRKNGRV